MILTDSPMYARAFERYLRKGTPIEISLKAIQTSQHSTPAYIWRTQGDGKVRASHAANNGKIFMWDSPPSTGNPGDDYGCRCRAEPYDPKVSEYAYQELIYAEQDAVYKWQASDFVSHARGPANNVTLQEIGQLHDIMNHYAYTLGIYQRVNSGIVKAAKKVRNGSVNWTFENSYDFEAVSYPHGDSTVGGEFTGVVTTRAKIIKVDGKVNYYFKDVFTDPIDLREIINGSSDPSVVSEAWRRRTDLGGKVYKVSGVWQTEFHAQANLGKD
jgi:SPP1 gp7 family putative phage head morphogenesis protein